MKLCDRPCRAACDGCLSSPIKEAIQKIEQIGLDRTLSIATLVSNRVLEADIDRMLRLLD